MADILKDPTDLAGIRIILGSITENDLSDTAIQNGFLEDAEAKIKKVLAAQANVASIDEIIAANDLDLVRLKAAVRYRVAYLFASSETNAVDVSQSIGPVQKDLGGLGETWIKQQEEFLKQVDSNLGDITGFKRWRTL
jgi:hypothetical protein